jgi:hypothetical protein
MDKVSQGVGCDIFNLYSDSPEYASQLLAPRLNSTINVSGGTALDVMAASTSAIYFIGTSSKISFWIACIRARIYNIPSSIPYFNEHELKNMVRDKISLIRYY